MVLYPFFAWWVASLLAGPFALLAWTVGHFVPAWQGPGLYEQALACALAGGAWSLVRRPQLRQVEVRIDGLPVELDGYRIGQISDVHLGGYTSAARVAAWVERLNAAQPDLVAVTGDLITSGGALVAQVAELMGRLRATDGVFACMGNHDYFVDDPETMPRALEQHGVTLLRNQGQRVRDGLYVAGVDDTWTDRADTAAALAGAPAREKALTLLLLHDPNLFPEAAERHVGLTLSGHTHGGQLAVPGLARKLTPARIITRYPAGLYRVGRSALYVNRGAGTTGPPVRLGAPAELTLLVLRRA